MRELRAALKDYQGSFPITLIVSEFNQDVTTVLKTGAIERLKGYGFSDQDIQVVNVPGAVEIPLIAQLIAKKRHSRAIIALGAVIRGETTHYDYVCDQVSLGCQKVMLEHEIPVIFGVLTTENEEQAWDRLGGNHGHKGKDAADTAVSMVLLKDMINLC